jgi:hypothetical protein
MLRAEIERRALGMLGVITLAAVVPACNAPGGYELPWLRKGYPDTTNVVQRPVFPLPEGRPLFVGGYAGASYGPNFRARPILVEPPGAPAPGQPNLSIDRGNWEPE